MVNYQFRQDDNWSLIYAGNLIAEDAPNSRLNEYYPIPDFQIPTPITKPIVGIYVTSQDDPGTWNKAGYAVQTSSTYVNESIVPNLEVTSRKLFLRKTNLCFFKKTGNQTYRIQIIRIPYWLRNISFKIWEYTGTIEDNSIQELKADIQDLEDKINLLL